MRLASSRTNSSQRCRADLSSSSSSLSCCCSSRSCKRRSVSWAQRRRGCYGEIGRRLGTFNSWVRVWKACRTCASSSCLRAVFSSSSCSFSRLVSSFASSSSLISCSRYFIDSSWARLFSCIFSWIWRCLPARTFVKRED